MKIQTLLLLAALLFLTACATSPASGEQRATDLELLRLGAIALSQDREPSGDIRRLEDADDFGEVYDYALDLEDTKALLHSDNHALINFLTNGLAAIERGRSVQCRAWQFMCKRRARNTSLQKASDPTQD